jgi:hypothetical protein
MLFALVANDCQFAVDVFVTRTDAEAALADALADEPQWVTLLDVVALVPGDDAFIAN